MKNFRMTYVLSIIVFMGVFAVSGLNSAEAVEAHHNTSGAEKGQAASAAQSPYTSTVGDRAPGMMGAMSDTGEQSPPEFMASAGGMMGMMGSGDMMGKGMMRMMMSHMMGGPGGMGNS
ncbi:MAG: hypothetical protein K9L59_12330 [Desulfobacterales bacterium]|nr:hypothetical protein [Desulfobacterales bacterium]